MNYMDNLTAMANDAAPSPEKTGELTVALAQTLAIQLATLPTIDRQSMVSQFREMVEAEAMILAAKSSAEAKP